ncbi:MAG: hypothetical protein II007_01630 [Gammaproteobacteria bacterium]|nr:hypothetical protein [Gammaproteobacteria bacterium]
MRASTSALSLCLFVSAVLSLPAVAEDWQRTVVFINANTTVGQDLFVKGGLSYPFAARFGLNCSTDPQLCAIPIRHHSRPTQADFVNDSQLDWFGPESGQSNSIGTPLVWTTNSWSSNMGAEKTVARDGYGLTPLNTFGSHYWMLDVEMDCDRTGDGWFEVKAFWAKGAGWEPYIGQNDGPYVNENHFAQCGRISVFTFGQKSYQHTSAPQGPQFSSSLPVDAYAGQPYVYQPELTMPAASGSRYQLLTGPEGMTINADTGELSWTPGSDYLNPSVDQLAVCELSEDDVVEQHSYADFADLNAFTLNGDAQRLNPAVQPGVLRLTDSLWQSASAFLRDPVTLRDSGGFRASFSTAFSFQTSAPQGMSDSDGQGADGVVFVVQTLDDEVGAVGGGIGYQGIAPSIGIEFDSWNNGAQDGYDGNHLGLNINGSVASQQRVKVDGRFNDGNPWFVWVDYEGASQRLEVRLARTNQRPLSAALSTQIDLPAILKREMAYIGFSAATGAAANVHDLLNWQFINRYAPVGEMPDLVPFNLQLMTQAGHHLLTADVINRGVKASMDGLSVANINGLPGSGASLGLAQLGGLAAGQTQRVQTTLDWSRVTSADWRVFADSQQQQHECDEANNQARAALVRILMRDPSGATAEQVGAITVRERNRPPVIVSEPVVVVGLGQDYRYPVAAVDPDLGDLLAFSLEQAPAGMVIDSVSGVITWRSLAIGEYPVTVKVSDRRGETALQSYVVRVEIANNQPPQITSLPLTLATEGNDYRYPVVAVDPNPGDQLSYGLTAGPAMAHIDTTTGLVSWQADPAFAYGPAEANAYCQLEGSSRAAASSADVVVVLDHSSSMSDETEWVADLVPALEGGLRGAGVGLIDANQYGLVFYSSYIEEAKVAGRTMGSYRDFLAMAKQFRFGGGTEDGYLGINHVLANYPLRPDVAHNIILVTDEPRDVVDATLTKTVIKERLQAANATLNVVVNTALVCGDGRAAFGLTADGEGLVADGKGSFLRCSGGKVRNAADRTNVEYVELVLGLGGAAWDLNVLRRGGLNAVSFSNALKTIKLQEIIRDLPSQPLADLALADLSLQQVGDEWRLAGTVVNRGLAATAVSQLVVTAASAELLRLPVPALAAGERHPFAVVLPLAMQTEVAVALVEDGSSPQCNTRNDQQRLARFGVKATDLGGLSAQQHYFVGVQAQPQPPVIAAIPSLQVGVGERLTYRLNAQDPNSGDNLRYRLLAGPSGLDVGEFSGRLTFKPDASVLGKHQVEVAVEDLGGLATSTSFELEVTGTAALPLRFDQAVGTVPFQANTTMTLDNPFVAPAGTEVVVSMVVGPDQCRMVDARQLSCDFGATVGDERFIFLQARDSYGNTADKTVIINRPPALTNSPRNFAVVDREYRFSLAASDPDGDAISYRLIAGPAGLTLSSAGQIVWTARSDLAGQTPDLILEVVDAQGASRRYTFGIWVTFNRAPEITSPPVVTAFTNHNYNYAVAVSDADGDSVTVQLLAAPDGMTISGRTLQWRPLGYQAGTHLVRVRAFDPFDGEDIQEFVLTVAANTAPTITSTPGGSAVSGNPYQYRMTASDAEGAALTWTLIKAPAGVSLSGATLNWTPTIAQVGSHELAVKVSDGAGGEATQTFTLVVSANSAPRITSAPVLSAKVAHGYRYWYSAVDPEGGALTWSLVSGPSGASVNSSYLGWTPTAAQVGEFPVTVRVTDRAGAFAEQSFTINAVANAVPRFTSVPVVNATSLHSYTYSVTATEPDGDSLRISLVTAPAGLSLSGWTLRWTPTAAQVGDHPVVIKADDYLGGEALQSFVISVQANRPPQITTVPPTAAAAGRALAYRHQATDPEGDSVTWALYSGPAGMTNDSYNGGYLRWTPTVAQIGSHRVVLQAVDQFGAASEHAFDLEVVSSLAFAEVPPAASIKVGDNHSARFVAVHPSASIGYQLVTAPTGLVHSAGGISWRPTVDDIGSHRVRVKAYTSGGEAAEAEYSIEVIAANKPPLITAVADQSAVSTQPWSYSISATDPEGQPLSYRLSRAPAGMVIDSASGVISWTPAKDQVAKHGVTVVVTDGEGMSASVAFNVTVTKRPNTAPEFTATAPTEVTVEMLYSFLVTTADADGDTVNLSLISAPAGMTLSASHLSWTPTAGQLGKHPVEIHANDGFDISKYNFTIDVTSSNPPPVATLHDLQDGQRITAPTTILASVDDSNLSQWELWWRPVNAAASAAQRLASGNAVVANATIHTLDPTMMVNGQYRLSLRAVDAQGIEAVDERTLVVDGDMKVGAFSITLLDLELPMAGMPIQVNRTYDSRRRSESLDFGYGWSVDYQSVKIEESRVPGTHWQLKTYATGPQGLLKKYCVEPIGKPQVSITLPTGEVERFDVGVSPACSDVVPNRNVSLTFKAAGDTTSKLEGLDDIHGYLIDDTLYDAGEYSRPLNPQRYRLTSRSGSVFLLDQGFGIREVKDREGNTLTYSRDGIVHSSGKAISFLRDGAGRITTITDPAGNSYRYSYDGAGDLRTSSDALGNVSSYTYYGDHGLRDLIDALGRRIVRNNYDSAGRLVSQTDSDGNVTRFDHNLAGRQSKVTDRLGRVSFFYYDDAGNVTSAVNALNETSSFTYDARGNRLTETNPLGETTTLTYNAAGERLSETDPLGNTVSYSVNDIGMPLTVTDAMGNITEMAYGINGRLEWVEDAAGNRFSNGYDGKGNVSLITDALGHETRYSYDANGNKLTEVAADGAEFSYGYDANNNLVSETRTRTSADGAVVAETTHHSYDAVNRRIATTDALGNTSRVEYDASGRETARVDAKGRRTEMRYDVYGNLLETRYPDGTSSSASYDKEGNKLTETDRLGRVTTYIYDVLNRVSTVKDAAGNGRQTTYDKAGRVRTERDARYLTTSYEYDATGRQTGITDAALGITSQDYNANGELIRVTDAEGRATAYRYDELGRRTATIFADGTEVQDEYDAAGRVVRRIDQAGRATSFGYDAMGRLVTVTDAKGGVTQYAYDEAGNKISQTDAEGRVTRWEYDALGREIARTLPLGQRETFVYDEVGNRISHTDFNGDTTSYEYDLNDRLIAVTYADGSEESYSYDAEGNRLAATTAEGTWSYGYDALNRLVEEQQPDGAVLAYSYDAEGNQTRLLISYANGTSRNQTQSYDNLNRLSSLNDGRGGSVTYSYDKVGNLRRISRAGGLTTDYSYDALHRLVQVLDYRYLASNVVNRLSYTLDATGRRLRIDEVSGRRSDYGYDELYRLISETITDPVAGNYSASYQYDAVGNRVYSIIDGVHTSYSLDANDRLLSEGETHYSYDANGSLIQEVQGADETSYSYNARNLLAEVIKDTAAGVSVAGYRYNPDGIRTSQSVDGVSTQLLVDSNRDYAQVVAEVDATGTAEGEYVHGLDLLSQHRAGVRRDYLADGLGSVRGLSQGVTVVDDYRYDAWGNQLYRSGSSANPYLYSGEWYDSALDQYYLRARTYAPQSGRFVQMDSWMGRQGEPVTLHKYLYGNGDPANTVDPSGHFGLVSMGVAMNIRSTLSNMQIEVGFNILDAALDPDSAASSAGGNLLMGLAAIGGPGAFKLLNMLSGKFRKVCSANSFEGETMVATEQGLVAIQNIRIGDKVWAYNEETGERSLQPVVHLIEGEGSKEIVEISLASGEVINATTGHPFYVDGEWKDAGALAINDLLLRLSGEPLAVVGLLSQSEQTKVYNLTVANDHTYYVGESEVLAHNANKCKVNGIVWGEPRPNLEINGKHVPGRPGYSRKAGTLPEDWQLAFNNAALFDGKNWWAKGQGGALYRYCDSNTGHFHWCGSTKDLMVPLERGSVPSEIIKAFGLPKKGAL